MPVKSVSQIEAAHLAGVSRTQIQRLIRKEPRPEWAVYVKEKRAWAVNVASPAWKKYCKQESTAAPTSTASLASAAAKAQLEIQIQKAELNRYKIEQEKLALKKAAGSLIEWDLAEFLFTGYLERINRELLAFPTRIKKAVELAAQDAAQTGKGAGEIAGVVCKLIVRETEAILRDVKAAQKAEVEAWQQEKGK